MLGALVFINLSAFAIGRAREGGRKTGSRAPGGGLLNCDISSQMWQASD